MRTNGFVALAVALALTACGDRANQTAGGSSGAPAVKAGSQPSPTDARSPALEPRALDARSLKHGPYTADARNRVAELAGSDGRAVSEAQQALTRIGRDPVPALVEALEGAHDQWIEQWTACGLTGLPDDAEVHLVGIVDRVANPVILVLSAYDPVVRKVGYTPRSNIAGVLVSGYHTQALIGIPRATPHRVLSGEQ